jgi:tetratricopeptide (TPR) repeat protein
LQAGVDESQLRQLLMEKLQSVKRDLVEVVTEAGRDQQVVRGIEGFQLSLVERFVDFDANLDETRRLLKEVGEFISNRVAQEEDPEEWLSRLRFSADPFEFAATELQGYAEQSLGEGDQASLALVEYLWGRLEEARFEPRAALRHYQIAVAAMSSNIEFLLAAGRAAMKVCEFRLAEQYFEKSVRMGELDDGVTGIEVAWRLNELGGALDQQYRLEEALDKFREALRLVEGIEGTGALRGYLYNNIGGILLALDDVEAAADHLRTAVEIRKTETVRPVDLILSLNNLAEARRKQAEQRLDHEVERRNLLLEAEDLLNEALFLSHTKYGARFPEHPMVAQTKNNLGSLLAVEFGNKRRGTALIGEAVEIMRKNFGDAHPRIVTMLANLGVLLADDDPLTAEEYLRRALRAAEKSVGENDPLYMAVAEEVESLKAKRALH